MKKFLSALLLFWSVSFSVYAQADFYVSVNDGNNMDDGSSPATAWASIQYAANHPSVGPGSTVHILGGTYAEQISIGVSGNDEDGVITFKAYEDDVVLIDGSSFAVDPVLLLNIDNEDYLKIQGLKFTGATGELATAIYIHNSASHIEITGNEISEISGLGSAGIVIEDATTVDVINNEISEIGGGEEPVGILVLGSSMDIGLMSNDISDIEGNFAGGIIVQDKASNIEIISNDISNVSFSTDPLVLVTSSTNANPLLIYGNDDFIDGSNGDPDIPPTPISNVIISGNHVHHSRTGFSEGLTVVGNVNNFFVTGNFVYWISNIGIDIAGGYETSPDPMQDYARNGTVNGNTVYQCRNEIGITGAGIYVDGAQMITVEHNKVYDCDRGFEIGCEVQGWQASLITLRNNMAFHNDHAGIAIGGYDYEFDPMDPLDLGSGKVTSSQVLNNTCYDNSQALFDEGELAISYTEDCVIKNNILHATDINLWFIVAILNRDGDGSENLVLDYNLYYHEFPLLEDIGINWYGDVFAIADFFDETMQDEHSDFKDPKFVDAINNDLHLGPKSPAFNKGDPMLLPLIGDFDIDGQMRLQFDTVDIGADEAAINLPVQYTSPLSARAITAGIELRWATGIEHDAALFEIQRSADGTVFEKIDAVATKGSNSAYSVVDRNPLNGNNYYRLKQIDLDGRSELSNVAMVKWEAGTTIGVFPNPAVNHFEIRISTGFWEKAVLRNTLGQTVRTFSTAQETTLDGLENGVYQLEVFETENAQPQVFSLMKG